MAREYLVFERDKYENDWFMGRHNDLMSAQYFVKRSGVSIDKESKFVIKDELGEEHPI